MPHFSQSQLEGAQLCFLLELEIFSSVHRFSSFPVDVLTAAGDPIPYQGGLKDVRLTESSELTGVDVEANSLSTAVVFDGLSVLQMWRKGYPIEGAKGELSYVLLKKGSVQQTHAERVLLLSGYLEQPVFADPEESEGFLAFSLSRDPWDPRITPENGGYLHASGMQISTNQFPNHDTESCTGKVYPIVIGGENGVIEDTATIPHQLNTFPVPAYCIKVHTPADPGALMMIAAHEIVSSVIGMKDPYGNFDTFNVVTSNDLYGNVISYVDARAGISGALFQYPGITLVGQPAPQKKEWWVTFLAGPLTERGGMLNPFGEGPLEGGGDICLWALTTGGADIDAGAWQTLAPVLNTFKFFGVINEKVKAWDWLTDNILPYLPIEVRNGPRGIKPVLSMMYSSPLTVIPVRSININPAFKLVSAVTTLTESADIANHISLQLGFDGFLNSYTSAGEVSDSAGNNFEDGKSDFAKKSVQIYGTKQLSLETNYIYDRFTAYRVLFWLLRSKSLPLRVADFRADVDFGWLQVGDVLEISSAELYLDKVKAVITGKSWDNTSWLFELAIEDSAILAPRMP